MNILKIGTSKQKFQNVICTSCKEKNDSKKNSYCTVFPGAPGKPCGPVGPLSPWDKLKQIMGCIQSHIGKGLDGVVHQKCWECHQTFHDCYTS